MFCPMGEGRRVCRSQLQQIETGRKDMDMMVDRRRLVVPGVGGLYEALAPYSFTLIRVALGLILIPHGFGKLFLSDAVPASRNFVNFGWAYPLAWAYAIGAL